MTKYKKMYLIFSLILIWQCRMTDKCDRNSYICEQHKSGRF